ncbi:MAG: hypothetical protein JRD89_05055 [Deltaproteobacteria bacterium]|nr:hypothetical protein [Deltaproteobacteria bacterium]
MKVYSRKLTCSASSEAEFEIALEGDVLERVRLRYPPGPNGLLRIALFYGIKELFPHEEGTYFYGDDEIIEFSPSWQLPERETTVRVKLVNDDEKYEHSVYLVLITLESSEMLANRIAAAVRSAIRRIFSMI